MASSKESRCYLLEQSLELDLLLDEKLLNFYSEWLLWNNWHMYKWIFYLARYKMMLLSSQIGAFSAQEFNKYLFGDVFGNRKHIIIARIICVTSVMLSGAGAVFEEQLRLPRQLGIFITVIACLIIGSRGLQGVLKLIHLSYLL